MHILVLAVALAAPAPDRAAADEGPRAIRLEAAHSVRMSSAALLVSGMSGGDLEVSPLAVALPSIAAESRVLVLLDVALATLPPEADSLDLEVAAYALTGAGEVAAATAVEFHLDSVENARGVQIVAALTLSPGLYTLRTIVRERGSGAVGLDSESLEVPAPSPDGLAAWLLRPGHSWIVGIADPVAPERLRLGSKIAAARPSLQPGDVALVHLLRLAGAADRRPVEARVIAGDGALVAILPVTVAPGFPAGLGVQAHDASFVVPDLPPGVYGLRVVYSGGPQPGASSELPFVVPLRPSDDLSVDLPAEIEGSISRPSRSPSSAAAGYRDLLHTLAAGDLAAAVSGLRVLENGNRRNGGTGGLQRFIRTERALMERMAREAPTALSALVSLHARLLEEYHATSGAAVPEMYAVGTLELLARLLAKRVETRDDRRAAARAASVAGAALQRAGWSDASDRAFGSAIALDDTSHAALLGAAAGREKAGDHRSAVALLSTLVTAEPEAEEARLRLALNLVRIGELSRGAEILRVLGSEAQTDWISIIAFQELARREEEPERAVEVLRQGLARWPDERGLLLQLALLLEPKQSATAIVDLLQPLLRLSGQGPSPRVRYNDWPNPSVGDLGEARSQRSLAAWLERGPGGR